MQPRAPERGEFPGRSLRKATGTGSPAAPSPDVGPGFDPLPMGRQPPAVPSWLLSPRLWLMEADDPQKRDARCSEATCSLGPPGVLGRCRKPRRQGFSQGREPSAPPRAVRLE